MDDNTCKHRHFLFLPRLQQQLAQELHGATVFAERVRDATGAAQMRHEGPQLRLLLPTDRPLSGVQLVRFNVLLAFDFDFLPQFSAKSLLDELFFDYRLMALQRECMDRNDTDSTTSRSTDSDERCWTRGRAVSC